MSSTSEKPARRKSVASIVRTAGAVTLAAAAVTTITTVGGRESSTAQAVVPEALSTHAVMASAAGSAHAAAQPVAAPPVLPGANQANVAAWRPQIDSAMAAAGINTPQRAAAFLAQVGQETAGFATLTEYSDGHDYNGRPDLGNTQAGDGPKYKGRGGLQLTGRNNYVRASQALGVDFVNHPELVSDPRYAFTTAAWYWTTHNLNAAADNAHPHDPASIDPVSQIINGGSNGQAVRRDQFVQVCQLLRCP